MIQIDFRDTRSIYEQIEQGLRELIIKGILPKDSQLPSVRELSVQLTVNPNTVQRAYKELENKGFVYSVKGKGSFVAGLTEDATDPRRKELLAEIEKLSKELKYLNTPLKTVTEAVEKAFKEGDGEK